MSRKQNQRNGKRRKQHCKKEEGTRKTGAKTICIKKQRGLPFFMCKKDRKIT